MNIDKKNVEITVVGTQLRIRQNTNAHGEGKYAFYSISLPHDVNLSAINTSVKGGTFVISLL